MILEMTWQCHDSSSRFDTMPSFARLHDALELKSRLGKGCRIGLNGFVYDSSYQGPVIDMTEFDVNRSIALCAR
jgi:hypothetical protein